MESFCLFYHIRYGYIIFTELMCYNQYYNLCWPLLLSSSVTHELFNYFFLQIILLLEYIRATLSLNSLNFSDNPLIHLYKYLVNRIVSHLVRIWGRCVGKIDHMIYLTGR